LTTEGSRNEHIGCRRRDQASDQVKTPSLITAQLTQSLIANPIVINPNEIQFQNMQNNEDMANFQSMSQSGDFQIDISAAPT
jgi:hypothetical protein